MFKEPSLATSSGRSGINLDRHGFLIQSQAVVIWVMDGVSPLLRDKHDSWAFRSFYKHADRLNDAIKDVFSSTLSLDVGLRELHNRNRSLVRRAFCSFNYGLVPLQSLGIMIVTVDHCDRLNVQAAIYGDCVILLRNQQGHITSLLPEGIENSKHYVDFVLALLRRIGIHRLSKYVKYGLFMYYRIMQYEFGLYQVFGSRRYYPPALRMDRSGLLEEAECLLMTDGLSWPMFHLSDFSAETMLDLVRKDGLVGLISAVRERERENTGFGYFDDATGGFLEVGARTEDPP